MIAATPLPRQSSSWQHELAHAITDPDELCTLLGIDPAGGARARCRRCSACGALRLLRRMRRCDPTIHCCDRFFGSSGADAAAGYSADPLAEAAARRAPGPAASRSGPADGDRACGVHRHAPGANIHAEDAGAGGRWQDAIGTTPAIPALKRSSSPAAIHCH
jgi:hypothetical protein